MLWRLLNPNEEFILRAKVSSLEVLEEGKTMMNSDFFHSFMKAWNTE